jgi:hypothetical protein
MSRALGGRTRLASHAAPIALPPPKPSPATGFSAWIALAAAPGAAYSAATDGTYIYAAGSGGGLFRYDTGADTWSSMATAPSAGEALISDGAGHLLLFGLLGTGGIAKYTIGSNTWDSGTVLTVDPTTRQKAAYAEAGGVVYVVGGKDASLFPANQYLSACSAYNIAGDSWSALTAATRTVAVASGAASGGKVYVLGGEEDSLTFPAAVPQAYSIAGNSWSDLPSPPSPAVELAAAVTLASGAVLYGGGDCEDGVTFTDNPAGAGQPFYALSGGTFAALGYAPGGSNTGAALRAGAVIGSTAYLVGDDFSRFAKISS